MTETTDDMNKPETGTDTDRMADSVPVTIHVENVAATASCGSDTSTSGAVWIIKRCVGESHQRTPEFHRSQGRVRRAGGAGGDGPAERLPGPAQTDS